MTTTLTQQGLEITPAEEFYRQTAFFLSHYEEYHRIAEGVLHTPIPSQLRHATDLTKFGQLNYSNRKSYRASLRDAGTIRSVRQEEAAAVVLSSAQ